MNNEPDCRMEIKILIEWCQNSLSLTISTKELMVDFRREMPEILESVLILIP